MVLVVTAAIAVFGEYAVEDKVQDWAGKRENRTWRRGVNLREIHQLCPHEADSPRDATSTRLCSAQRWGEQSWSFKALRQLRVGRCVESLEFLCWDAESKWVRIKNVKSAHKTRKGLFNRSPNVLVKGRRRRKVRDQEVVDFVIHCQS